MDSRVVTLDTGLFVCNGAIEDRGNLWPYGDVSTNFHSGVLSRHGSMEPWGKGIPDGGRTWREEAYPSGRGRGGYFTAARVATSSRRVARLRNRIAKQVSTTPLPQLPLAFWSFRI